MGLQLLLLQRSGVSSYAHAGPPIPTFTRQVGGKQVVLGLPAKHGRALGAQASLQRAEWQRASMVCHGYAHERLPAEWLACPV